MPNAIEMIESTQVSQLMGSALPELKDEVSFLQAQNNPYQCLSLLSDYTRHAVEVSDDDALERSFQFAAQLYSEGAVAVRRAVENVYVYTLSHLLQAAPAQWAKLMERLPRALRNVYYAQVLPASGC